MNNESIVISEDGFKVMNFSIDFTKCAREHGIRDPFEVSRQLFSKRIYRNEDGGISVTIERDEETDKVKEDPAEPTREEKDNWIAMRDEYIARRCFNEIGYESFLFHTKPYNYECNYDISHMRNEIEFVPCKSADKQCAFDCVKFAECALNGTWSPD